MWSGRNLADKSLGFVTTHMWPDFYHLWPQDWCSFRKQCTLNCFFSTKWPSSYQCLLVETISIRVPFIIVDHFPWLTDEWRSKDPSAFVYDMVLRVRTYERPGRARRMHARRRMVNKTIILWSEATITAVGIPRSLFQSSWRDRAGAALLSVLTSRGCPVCGR